MRPAALVALLSAGWLPAGAAAQLPDSTGMEPSPTEIVEAPPADTLPLPDWAAPIPPSAQASLDYVLTASPDTPGGMGLLETAMAEARVALEHVRLAGRDSASLGNMTRHAAHVIHAIDPNQATGGPGMGYGVRQAARGMEDRLEELQSIEDLPGALRFHAPLAVRAARGAAAQAVEAVTTARALQRATSTVEGRRLVRRLDALVIGMAYGTDRDDDGRIGYAEEESGLAQVEYHLTLVRRITAPR